MTNKNIRILMLEDTTSDADLIEFELMEAGFKFISKRTANEKEFIRGLREFSPELILSDYNLPQYTGLMALVEAKRLHPKVPFILVTGAFEEHGEQLNEILAKGADDYVLKSRLDHLAPAVHKAIGKMKETLITVFALFISKLFVDILDYANEVFVF